MKVQAITVTNPLAPPHKETFSSVEKAKQAFKRRINADTVHEAYAMELYPLWFQNRMHDNFYDADKPSHRFTVGRRGSVKVETFDY